MLYPTLSNIAYLNLKKKKNDCWFKSNEKIIEMNYIEIKLS